MKPGKTFPGTSRPATVLLAALLLLVIPAAAAMGQDGQPLDDVTRVNIEITVKKLMDEQLWSEAEKMLGDLISRTSNPERKAEYYFLQGLCKASKDDPEYLLALRLFDLAIALEHCWGKPAFPEYRDALLEGYSKIRPLSKEQTEHIELFLAAFQIYWNLWAAGIKHRYPGVRKKLDERIRRTTGLVAKYSV